VEAVREGLRALLYSDPDEPLAPNPLWQLTLIDHMLLDPALPRVEKVRHRMLCLALVEGIEWGAAFVRTRSEAPLLHTDWRRADILSELKRIAPFDNMELRAWTVLYARYVLVGAGIEPHDIANALGLQARQNRRLHTYGVKLLTEYLIQREWEARIHEKRFRLFSRVPVSALGQVVGRDEWIATAHRLMSENGQKLLVMGEAGMGKKALVRALLARMIDADQIDQLLWLTKPPSAGSILLRIQEALCTEPVQRFVLEHYLHHFRFVLVLDNLDLLENAPEALDRLLGQLGRAKVILIHKDTIAFDHISARLPVRPLDRRSLSELFDLYWARFHTGANVSEIERNRLIADSGGSPTTLRRLIWHYGDEASAIGDTPLDFSRIFRELSPAAQFALLAVATLSPDGNADAKIGLLWEQRIDEAVLHDLVTKRIVERTAEEAIRLTSTWRDWLAHTLSKTEELRLPLEDVFQVIDTQLHTDNFAAISMIEALLGTPWVPIDHARRLRWLNTGWRSAVAAGRWAGWLELLRQATDGEFADDPGLWLGRGLCARRGNEWQECIYCLQRAIELAGESGQFSFQTEALLERSIVLRLHGFLGRAGDELAIVQRYAKQYRLTSIGERARLEEAQLALERDDPDTALTALETVRPGLHSLLLRAEACSLKGDVGACGELVRALDGFAELDATARARLHTIKARLYRQKGERELFRIECESAVMLLEQGDDQYNLGRAYNNLGTAILEVGGSHSQAIALFRRAEKLQRALRDRVALFASRHNRSIARLP
jgi:tetratricopeptide (TPR) repeat protein